MAQQTPALSFAEGLQRLIGHAVSRFSEDLGPQLAASDAMKIYALNFTIAGLTECRVSRNAYTGTVTCDGYRGRDAGLAQAAFDDFEQRLRAFAGARGRFFVESFSLTTESVTVASYWPSDAVDITVTKQVSKGAYSVVFKTARNPS